MKNRKPLPMQPARLFVYSASLLALSALLTVPAHGQLSEPLDDPAVLREQIRAARDTAVRDYQQAAAEVARAAQSQAGQSQAGQSQAKQRSADGIRATKPTELPTTRAEL